MISFSTCTILLIRLSTIPAIYFNELSNYPPPLFIKRFRIPSNVIHRLSSILTAAFISLALTFIHRNASASKYFGSAAVASISIALGSVYVSNFFGVYI